MLPSNSATSLNGDARLLQKNAGEGVTEAVRRRLNLPRAANIPNHIQLPAPEFGDHIKALGGVLAENMAAMFLGPLANAVLKPLRNPCVNMRAGLRGADTDFAVRQHAVDVKQRHIRNAKASVDRQRDEIGKIVAIPFVLARSLPYFWQASYMLLISSSVNGSFCSFARLAISLPFGFLTLRAGLLCDPFVADAVFEERLQHRHTADGGLRTDRP